MTRSKHFRTREARRGLVEMGIESLKRTAKGVYRDAEQEPNFNVRENLLAHADVLMGFAEAKQHAQDEILMELNQKRTRPVAKPPTEIQENMTALAGATKEQQEAYGILLPSGWRLRIANHKTKGMTLENPKAEDVLHGQLFQNGSLWVYYRARSHERHPTCKKFSLAELRDQAKTSL